MNHTSLRVLVPALCLAAFVGACPLLPFPSPNPDGSENVSRGEGEGDTCNIASDCDNIACLCEDGSTLGMPVNTRNCDNGRCQSASEACPDSCDGFGYSWTGSVVGADPSGGGGGGGGDDGSCSNSSDCAPHTCFCPDGSEPLVRDCLDTVCQGADLCEEQCCLLGHC